MSDKRCNWPRCTCPGEEQCPVIEQEYSAFRGAAVANRTRCYEDLRELREENAELRCQLAAALARDKSTKVNQPSEDNYGASPQ